MSHLNLRVIEVQDVFFENSRIKSWNILNIQWYFFINLSDTIHQHSSSSTFIQFIAIRNSTFAVLNFIDFFYY